MSNSVIDRFKKSQTAPAATVVSAANLADYGQVSQSRTVSEVRFEAPDKGQILYRTRFRGGPKLPFIMTHLALAHKSFVSTERESLGKELNSVSFEAYGYDVVTDSEGNIKVAIQEDGTEVPVLDDIDADGDLLNPKLQFEFRPEWGVDFNTPPQGRRKGVDALYLKPSVGVVEKKAVDPKTSKTWFNVDWNSCGTGLEKTMRNIIALSVPIFEDAKAQLEASPDDPQIQAAYDEAEAVCAILAHVPIASHAPSLKKKENDEFVNPVNETEGVAEIPDNASFVAED